MPLRISAILHNESIKLILEVNMDRTLTSKLLAVSTPKLANWHDLVFHLAQLRHTNSCLREVVFFFFFGGKERPEMIQQTAVLDVCLSILAYDE
jgi:hypothetical protein